MPSIIRLPHLPQEHDFSCVAACARMVLAFYGKPISEAELRRILKTRPGIGTHPIHLRNLESLGVAATWPYPSTSAELQQLVDAGHPIIAFVWTGSLRDYTETEGIDYLHTVVVVGFSDPSVLVHDPRLTTGPIEIPRTVFADAWKYADHLIAVISPA
ncbi:MAG: C39 family peptidase [Chloroflexi bacterium]|nr:C39 family peptidase [Chloroflexota bacterium]